MLSPEDCARLPGPTRALNDIAIDMNAGRTVVVVFPDHLVDDGTADNVIDELLQIGGSAVFCDSGPEPFPTRILATFTHDLVPHRAYDSWESIITWENWHGSWVVLTGWNHHDVSTVVDRWPAQLHASSLHMGDRPKLLLGLRLCDVDRTRLKRLDRDTIAVHWWWGVLDRLDTETRLAGVAGRHLNLIDAAVITEVAGWDLDCVDFLTERWDRTTTGLPTAVRAYQASAPAVNTDVAAAGGAATTIPSADREKGWRDGLIDRWGHSLRHSPRILDDKGIAQRLWLAHNRTLIPLVDEERAHFENLILSVAKPHALDDLDRRDDDIIEIGALAWLATSGRVTIGRQNTDRLCTFRDLRNDLAHRNPVNDTLRKRIIGYLDL